LLVYRESRSVESCTRVGEVKYLKHFLAVARSTGSHWLLANRDIHVFFIRISYLATAVKSLQQKKNSLHQSPIDSGGLCSFILVLWYYQVSRYLSHYH